MNCRDTCKMSHLGKPTWVLGVQSSTKELVTYPCDQPECRLLTGYQVHMKWCIMLTLNRAFGLVHPDPLSWGTKKLWISIHFKSLVLRVLFRVIAMTVDVPRDKQGLSKVDWLWWFFPLKVMVNVVCWLKVKTESHKVKWYIPKNNLWNSCFSVDSFLSFLFKHLFECLT